MASDQAIRNGDTLHTQGLNVNSTRNAQLIIAARLISDFGAFLNMVALATYVYLLSNCLLYTSPSPRDLSTSRMPSSA